MEVTTRRARDGRGRGTGMELTVRKHVVFEEPDTELFIRYSRFKLGDVNVMRDFSSALTMAIRKKVPLTQERYALYATTKSPRTEYCKKNSLILAELVAYELQLPLIVGEYSYRYDKKQFYENQENRKIAVHRPVIKEKENLRKLHCKFIMTDDSLVTGSTLEASLKELEGVTDTVEFFVLLDLSDHSISEQRLNDIAFGAGNIELLAEIILHEEYIFTSHMVRTIDALDPFRRGGLFDIIGQEGKERYCAARGIYFDEVLPYGAKA